MVENTFGNDDGVAVSERLIATRVRDRVRVRVRFRLVGSLSCRFPPFLSALCLVDSVLSITVLPTLPYLAFVFSSSVFQRRPQHQMTPTSFAGCKQPGFDKGKTRPRHRQNETKDKTRQDKTRQDKTRQGKAR
jgi:hypothetical protein